MWVAVSSFSFPTRRADMLSHPPTRGDTATSCSLFSLIFSLFPCPIALIPRGGTPSHLLSFLHTLSLLTSPFTPSPSTLPLTHPPSFSSSLSLSLSAPSPPPPLLPPTPLYLFPTPPPSPHPPPSLSPPPLPPSPPPSLLLPPPLLSPLPPPPPPSLTPLLSPLPSPPPLSPSPLSPLFSSPLHLTLLPPPPLSLPPPLPSSPPSPPLPPPPPSLSSLLFAFRHWPPLPLSSQREVCRPTGTATVGPAGWPSSCTVVLGGSATSLICASVSSQR